MYAKIAHSRVFLHLYLIRSSNTFVNNMLFKQKLNTREDRVIKAICGSYLGWDLTIVGKSSQQSTILGKCPRKAATNLPWQSARKHENESETMTSFLKLLILPVSVIPKMPRVRCYKICTLVDGDLWVCNWHQKARKIKGTCPYSPLVWSLHSISMMSNYKEMRRVCMLRQRNNGAWLRTWSWWEKQGLNFQQWYPGTFGCFYKNEQYSLLIRCG